MADPQVLLKHEVTGHTALFPAAADMDTWQALGWHPIPAEDATSETPAAEAPKSPKRPACAGATESEEQA